MVGRIPLIVNGPGISPGYPSPFLPLCLLPSILSGSILDIPGYVGCGDTNNHLKEASGIEPRNFAVILLAVSICMQLFLRVVPHVYCVRKQNCRMFRRMEQQLTSPLFPCRRQMMPFGALSSILQKLGCKLDQTMLSGYCWRK